VAKVGGAAREPVDCHDVAMTTPTIRLATDDDMRAITSQNLDQIRRLPCLYIATDEPDVMRSWGVALERTFGDFERLYPGALVAPHYDGQTVSRGDLLYNGAEPAAASMPRL
jgi:hypothetical protein